MSRFLLGCICIALYSTILLAEDALRPTAVVNLTFDEADGPALDTATVGQAADNGTLKNVPLRVPSPFWNQSGKQAIQFDGTKSQYVELADSADLDRPDAVTLSLLCVNLTPTNDAAFHGLIAKRGAVAEGKFSTNYGINFTMQNDNCQFYIHDGAGYRVATYSTKEMLPFRKLIHVAAVIQVGDAPGNDADSDADDVRFQVFVNGKPLTPKSVTSGFVDGTNGWATDVQIANLVNDIPLALGRSEAAGEYFTGVIDEFCLFPQALTPEQVQRLFLEVAGANVEQLIQHDQAAAPAKPEINRINPPGLVIGQTTQVTVAGKNLLPSPQLSVPIPGAKVEIVDQPTAERLTAKITVPADAVPAIVPVFAQTEHGLTAPELISVDVLPLKNIQRVSAQEPAELPAAYWGTLQGGNVVRLDFAGKAGQRFVADVELRRLGGSAQPVLELKNQQGAPLVIAWGHSWLGGDTRIETTLPADGLYALELHDLVYRAPGMNAFRLKVGDLQLLDLPFPAAAVAGPVTVEPVGSGFAPGTKWTSTFSPLADAAVAPLPLPRDVRVPGPRPVVNSSPAAAEIVEADGANREPQSVPATFTDSKQPIGINGRLRQPRERDLYLLQVTPGQKLRFTLETESIGSPVEGELAIRASSDGKVLAMTSDQPSPADPRLDFTVPANTTQLQVAVRDLFGRGGERSIYRIEIAPAEYPAFELAVNTGALSLPADGSAIVEVTVTRQGYNGPIALRIVGDDALQIAPTEISAGMTGKVLCRMQRNGPARQNSPELVRLVGSSVGVEPAASQFATVVNATPAYRDAIAAATTAPTGLSLELLQPPAKFFKGVTHRVPVKLIRTAELPGGSAPVRFTEQSTEPKRLRQPANPAAGTFPVVAVAPAQLAASQATEFTVAVQTPMDVIEKSIQFVIVAEAVPHAYSDRVLATAYAVPFRAAVENAVDPKLDDATLKVIGETDHAVTGKLQRTAGFTDPVEVTLTGLPAGYQVIPAAVPGDQNDYRITVKGPKPAAEIALENVKLRVTSQGSLIAAESAVALKVAPQ